MSAGVPVSPSRPRVLCIGNSDSLAEAARWLTSNGLEPTRMPDGELVAAVATEDVLDGLCTATEAIAMQHVRARDVPCVSVLHTRRVGAAAVG